MQDRVFWSLISKVLEYRTASINTESCIEFNLLLFS